MGNRQHLIHKLLHHRSRIVWASFPYDLAILSIIKCKTPGQQFQLRWNHVRTNSKHVVGWAKTAKRLANGNVSKVGWSLPSIFFHLPFFPLDDVNNGFPISCLLQPPFWIACEMFAKKPVCRCVLEIIIRCYVWLCAHTMLWPAKTSQLNGKSCPSQLVPRLSYTISSTRL